MIKMMKKKYPLLCVVQNNNLKIIELLIEYTNKYITNKNKKKLKYYQKKKIMVYIVENIKININIYIY